MVRQARRRVLPQGLVPALDFEQALVEDQRVFQDLPPVGLRFGLADELLAALDHAIDRRPGLGEIGFRPLPLLDGLVAFASGHRGQGRGALPLPEDAGAAADQSEHQPGEEPGDEGSATAPPPDALHGADRCAWIRLDAPGNAADLPPVRRH